MPLVKLAEIVDSDLKDSKNSLGMDEIMKPSNSSDCRVLGEFIEKPSYQGEFSPTLKDVVVLLQLSVFGRVNLTLLRPDYVLLKLVRHLQMSLSDAG
ncbi:hypothetical protein AHAS_AhasUnG0033000 [Arachis hypogaea]